VRGSRALSREDLGLSGSVLQRTDNELLQGGLGFYLGSASRHTKLLLHVHQDFGVHKCGHQQYWCKAIIHTKKQVCIDMHPKKVGVHAYTPQKRQKIGVQWNVHQVIWCT
jgi:hypothetical protein